MEKDRKILLLIIGTILLIALTIVIFTLCTRNSKTVVNTDALKFKEEYEKINGVENKDNHKVYLKLNIDKDNMIKYNSEEEIVNILKNGSGVIYMGFPNCPWCRSMIETLIDTAKENKIKEIYYLNILDIRDSYEIQDGKIIKTKEGTKDYYKILKALDKYLSDYSLTDEEGNEISTGVKRLYAPTVVVVKNGRIVGFREDVVESLIDPYQGLNESQKTELKAIYQRLFDNYKGNTCNNHGC